MAIILILIAASALVVIACILVTRWDLGRVDREVKRGEWNWPTKRYKKSSK